jgi:hypothetical protein
VSANLILLVAGCVCIAVGIIYPSWWIRRQDAKWQARMEAIAEKSRKEQIAALDLALSSAESRRPRVES